MIGPRSGLVAVLFTDLVGSTELMSQLGDRAFDDLRRRHFAALGKAVAAHGGEEVKNTGDGIMAVFPSAAEAVEAAVAMQQATARQAKGSPVAIRVGVAVGDATFEDGDYFGTPVVEAARLVAAARSGEILATAVVRMLAGSRSTATFTDQGPLDLKGLPEPLAVCQVAWEPAASSVPMPALLTDVGRVFVGRDAELERLHLLWKEASAGERRLALVAGEPGVGKTRLATELAVAVHEEGGTVLAGRCDEDLGVPFQPFVEALRHFVDHASVADLPEHLGRYGGELARLLPELTARLPDLPPPLTSDPETERYRLFDAVAAWLAAVSAENPVLLVLDDLQWAAKPTLLLLRHVVRSGETMRLLVVGTYRDTELAHDHPLLEVVADLRRHVGVDRMALAGLDDVAVAAFVEQAAGRELDDDAVALARAIYQETQGNPFFLKEVLRHLTETGAVVRLEGGWSTHLPIEELGIPEGVRDVVGRRLTYLSKDANRLLQVAAVVGAEFDLDVLGRADVLDEDDLIAAVEEATSARLVVEAPGTAPRYRFAHALVRDTLYQGLSAARRTTLHRRVAEAIEAVHGSYLDDYLPALAHHWARAAAPAAETARAVDYATRAGDRALAQLAHDEAVVYYQQALELFETAPTPSDQRRRQTLLVALGVAQRRAGHPAHRETLLQAAALAREIGDADRLAEAAIANSRSLYSYTLGLDAERIEVLEAALDALPAGESPTRARLLARLGQELVFASGGGRHYRLTAEGLAMARRLGDRAALADALSARMVAIFADPGFSEEWIDGTGEMLALAREVGDPSLRAHAACMRFGAVFQAGMFSQADRALDEQERAVAEAGQPFNRWFLLLCRTGRLLVAGCIADAAQSMDETLELGLATGQPDARQFHATTRFEMLYETGRLHEDVERLIQAADASGRPVVRAMLALAYSELGRYDDARYILEPLIEELPELPRSGGPWWRTIVPAALACAPLGDPRLTEALFELLRPYAELITGTLVAWSAAGAHHLGMLATALGRLDGADAHFSNALAIHASIPAPTWLARTRLEWARMLLTRRGPGDAERAEQLLGQALDSARELGLATVERRAVELLR